MKVSVCPSDNRRSGDTERPVPCLCGTGTFLNSHAQTRPPVGLESLSLHSATRTSRSCDRCSSRTHCANTSLRARASSRLQCNDTRTFAFRSQGGDPASKQAAS